MFAVDGLADASDLEEQKKALDVIADFADRLCKTIPLEGSADNLEFSGSAKVELNALIKKIVDLGIEGAAKYKTEEWQGVLQKDLTNLLKDNIDCRIEVWKDLKDKLIIFSVKPGSETEIESLVFSDDFEKHRHWLETKTHPNVKAYYDQGGFVVENASKNLSAYYGFHKLGVIQRKAKIELSVKKLSGAQDQTYGFMFGSTDSKFGNCYTFSIREDGIYMVVKRVDNKQDKFIQWRFDPVIKTGIGTWNRLRVDIKGRTINYFINDKQLGHYTADNEVMGFIGVFSDNPGLKAVFDDLQVVEYKTVAQPLQ